MICYAVPLCISGAHLVRERPTSVDCAVQFYVLAALFMVIEQSTSTKFAFVLLLPLLCTAGLGVLFHVMGDFHARVRRVV
jgi:hypothetical protein